MTNQERFNFMTGNVIAIIRSAHWLAEASAGFALRYRTALLDSKIIDSEPIREAEVLLKHIQQMREKLDDHERAIKLIKET